MKSLHSFLGALAAMGAASAFSQTYTPQCKPDGDTQQMNACAYRDYKRADTALNTAYKAKMASLPAARQEQLRAEQRVWVKERDPSCKEAAKESEGGSIWTLEFYGCLQTATERRTKEIQAWRGR